MAAAMVRALLLLPFMALVVIPVCLLWFVEGPRWFWDVDAPGRIGMLAPAMVLCGYGAWMGVRTCRLFLRSGRGTPAPWDPPKHLVVEGPYRRVRNPMMSAVFALLVAESLLLGSWAIAAWTAVFVVGNAFYIPLSEEPGLQKRFGEAYVEYKRNVPRWIPRITPWRCPPGST